MIYFEYFSAVLWPYELYYQYTPIRTIFPALLLPLSYSYFSTPSKLKYFGILGIFSVGVLWNLDTGLFTYLAFIAVLIFNELLTNKNIYNKMLSVFRHFTYSTLVFTGVLGLFILYIFFRYGSWPTLYDIIGSQLLYIGGSIMPIFGAWSLIISIYFLGIIFSIRAVVNKEKSINTIMILLITILGVGLFTYHLNNPHNSTLANSGWPSIIVFTLLASKLLSSRFAKTRDFMKLRLKKPLSLLLSLYISIVVFVIAFFAVCFIVNANESIETTDMATIDQIIWPTGDNKRPLWEIEGPTASETAYLKVQDLLQGDKPVPPWLIKADFLKKYVKQGSITDDILILSAEDYYLYMKLSARAPIISVNFWHLFLDKEWELLYNQLETKKNRYVVLDNSFGVFQGDIQIHLLKYHEKTLNLVKKNYKKIDSKIIGTSYYLGKWYPSELIVYERM
jgi:hypothetical protein